MFPIGDDRIQGGPPALVTYGLIALNVLAFVIELGQGSEGALQAFIQAWGVVPREYTTMRDLPPTIPLPFWSTLVTSMFLHGGWMHLGGNMLYLWIFGDNLEDALGHGRYLVFYLLTGVLAGLAHVFVTAFFGADRLIPSLGASGAISGVLGGYIVLYPQRRVRVLWLYQVMHVPAILAIGIWFLFQLISGAGTLGASGGGVAYGAHIGGFVAGAVLVKLFAQARPAYQVV